MNTDQIFFNHLIKESIIILGDIINTSTIIKTQMLSLNPDDKAPAIVEFDNLLKTLTEVQMTFADIDILLDPSLESLHSKVSLDNISQISNVLSKAVADINTKLPKRDTPIIARGNQLAVMLFKLNNTVNLCLQFINQQDNNQASKVTYQFLKSISDFTFIAARWANIFINQKEYIWTEPRQIPPQNQTTSPQDQTINPNTLPQTPSA